MEIRLMQLFDYEEVMSLWRASATVGLGPDDSRDHLEKYLQRNPKTSFVAEIDGKVVGAIMAGHDGYRGFIHHTAVAQEHRGKGIGRKLAESAVSALKGEGINKAVLVVQKSNAAGNMFWNEMGFSVRGDLYYRDLRID